MPLISTLIYEVNMAKRRNLKKEKAQRNKEYARRFRKPSGRNSRSRFGGFNRQQGSSTDNSSGATDAADVD